MSIMISRNQLIDDAMQAQKQIVQAMHAAAEPTWLQLDLTMAQLKGLFALADSPMTIGQLAEALGSGQRLIPIMASVMLGMLLASVDQTIVGTAMPRIIAQLNGLEHYAWVATAYLLASTVSVPIYGKLSDIYGRKAFFIVGMVIFLLGSALSGMSQTMTQLIFFRAVQGLGAGAMMPIAMSI